MAIASTTSFTLAAVSWLASNAICAEAESPATVTGNLLGNTSATRPADLAATANLHVKACDEQLSRLATQIDESISQLTKLGIKSAADVSGKPEAASWSTHLAVLERERKAAIEDRDTWARLAMEATLQQEREQNRREAEAHKVDSNIADEISGQRSLDQQSVGDPIEQAKLMQEALDRARDEKQKQEQANAAAAQAAVARAEAERTAAAITRQQEADRQEAAAKAAREESLRRDAARAPVRAFVSSFKGKPNDAADVARDSLQRLIDDRATWAGQRVISVDPQAQPDVLIVGEIVQCEPRAVDAIVEGRRTRLTYVTATLHIAVTSPSGRSLGECVVTGESRSWERVNAELKAKLNAQAVEAAIKRSTQDGSILRLIRGH